MRPLVREGTRLVRAHGEPDILWETQPAEGAEGLGRGADEEQGVRRDTLALEGEDTGAGELREGELP